MFGVLLLEAGGAGRRYEGHGDHGHGGRRPHYAGRFLAGGAARRGEVVARHHRSTDTDATTTSESTRAADDAGPGKAAARDANDATEDDLVLLLGLGDGHGLLTSPSG